MKRLIHVIGSCLLSVAVSAPLRAGEYVVLDTGLRLHADRHEVDGGIARIFSGSGVVEMPVAAIAGYEPEEIVPAPQPPIAPPAALPSAAPSLTPETPAELATAAAQKYLLPDSFVRSVMKAESGFQPDAVSPRGAIGLMQLMPETARELGVDPKDPHQNADGGAQYLRLLLAKYEDDPNQVLLALAAYNAGPAAVERWHGVPPYRETREYILRVLRNWQNSAK
jgi:soluble lytic murein transglycosylase-like protein